MFGRSSTSCLLSDKRPEFISRAALILLIEGIALRQYDLYFFWKDEMT